MRKNSLLFILIILVFVLFNNLNNDNFYNYFKNYENVEFCYVLGRSIENEKIQNNVLVSKIVKNGAKNQLYFKKLNNKIHIQADYKQVSFKLSAMQINKILSDFNIKIVLKECIENKVCLYGYSSMFKNFCMLGNKKINFHFVYSNNQITIGCPLIYSSF